MNGVQHFLSATDNSNNSNASLTRLNKLVGELRELLKYSRDVELRQVLERLESTMVTLMKVGQAADAIENTNHQESRDTATSGVGREDDLMEDVPADDRVSLRSLTTELHFERENRASLRHHLDEFQTLLDRVRAENHQLSLSLSEVETERLRERHMWLVAEAELKSNTSVLTSRVRRLEEENERLRTEVADSHCRAATVVRDTHVFLASVRQGLLRFVRDLRTEPPVSGDSPRPKKNASLREMIRLVKEGTRSIDASSDAWIAHLSEAPTKIPASEIRPEKPRVQEEGGPRCKNQDDTMVTGQFGFNSTLPDYEETYNTSNVLSTSESIITMSLNETTTISHNSFRQHLKDLDHKLASLQSAIHKST